MPFFQVLWFFLLCCCLCLSFYINNIDRKSLIMLSVFFRTSTSDYMVWNIRPSSTRLAWKFLLLCNADNDVKWPNLAKYNSVTKFSMKIIAFSSSVILYSCAVHGSCLSSGNYFHPHCVLKPSAVSLHI